MPVINAWLPLVLHSLLFVSWNITPKRGKTDPHGTDELSKDAESSNINDANISQPACTAVQLALTDLLRAWGIYPTAVAGHSSGEISAAYAAGILPLDSCMAISYYRGMVTLDLKNKFPNLKGSMMAVGGSQEEIAPLIKQLKNREVRIACFNSPTSLTISGDEPAIDELQVMLEERGMFNRKLQVDVAYHSHHMRLVASDYQACLQWLGPPKASLVKFHSSLLGHLVDGTTLQPSYWVANLTQAVRFSEALSTMCAPANGHKTGVNMIIELGPHSALAGPVKQILKACGPSAMKIPYASALIRKKDAVQTAVDLAGTLFVKGVNVNFGAVNFPKVGKPPALLVDLPRYPWNHSIKYWHEGRMQVKHKTRTTPRNDILGVEAIYSNDLEPTWRNIVRTDDLPWLRHHKIQSLTLFPMSGFVAMAVEAASQRAISKGVHFDKFELRNIVVSAPLMITDGDIEMTTQLRPYQEGNLISSDLWKEFRIHSWAANKGWTEHCKGLVAVKTNDSNEIDGARLAETASASLQATILEINSTTLSPVDKVKMYDSLSELGVSYGPTFQGINNCQATEECSTADITVVDTTQEMPQGYQTSNIVHPAFLEQLIEMYWPILGAGRTSVDTVYLPSSIGHLSISRDITELTKNPGSTLRAFCKGSAPSTHPKPIQVSMFATASDSSREAIVKMDDLTISPIIERDMVSETEAHRELCYKIEWEPILHPLTHALKNGVSNGTSNGISTPSEASETSNDNSNGVLTPETNDTSVSGEGSETSSFPDGQVVIVHGDSEAQKILASKIADTLENSTGRRPEISTLADVNAADKLWLFLSELEKPLLSTLTPEQFTSLQKTITTVQGILWVVRGAYDNSDNPDSNMVAGFSRTVRSETMLKFATLDLDSKAQLSVEDTMVAILDIFKAVFGPKAETNCELEFMERQGAFFTPRIVNDPEMNEYVHKQTQASTIESAPFVQEDRPLKMTIGTPGAFETLHFVDDIVAEEALFDDEIEIEVKAIGMNAKDVTIALGQHTSFDFGVECSGIVTKSGSITKFAVGDRVAAISLSQGVYSTFARTKATLAFKIEEDMSFETAASIPIAYCTAQYGLSNLGSLAADESILIHGAASPAGQAAISIAQTIGAKVFATVANLEEKDILTSTYSLAEDHIFSTKHASFGNAIRQATNLQGVDVVFNSTITDSDTMRETWDCLSSFGRFIEVGKGDTTTRLETARSNTSFMSVDILSLAAERPKIMQKLLSDVAELLKKGSLKAASPITVFPISDVETAFKVLQSGTTSGKLVVSPQPQDEVKVNTNPQPPSSQANKKIGNPIQETVPTITSRRILHPHRRHRWSRPKHDKVDGQPRRQNHNSHFKKRFLNRKSERNDR
jgi:NADPH:quinone reductase-like Zn-dependent oxidoreductase/malonyl CoA-acyl carrier protein transacylase